MLKIVRKMMIIIKFAVISFLMYEGKASRHHDKHQHTLSKIQKIHQRMVNSHDAPLVGYKFLLQMKFTSSRMKFKVCEASILNTQWALTAAHCIANITDYPDDLKLYPANDLTNEISVSEILPHPEAQRILGWPEKKRADGATEDKSHFDYDIALMKFSTPLIFNDKVEAIEIPEQNFDILANKPFQCRSAGWGSQEQFDDIKDVMENNYNVAGKLQEIMVPIVSNSFCNSESGGYIKFPLSDLSLCANKKIKRQTPCLGDSGAPVICTVAGGRNYKLYGFVVSGGYKCNPLVRAYSMTRVSKFSDWINEIIES